MKCDVLRFSVKHNKSGKQIFTTLLFKRIVDSLNFDKGIENSKTAFTFEFVLFLFNETCGSPNLRLD